MGRSYLDTGELVWRTLPARNVRLIAITDRYDSIEDNRASRFKMSLINVVNASYSQDISKKVKSTIRLKQKNGTYIAASVPFGYTKEVYGGDTKYAMASRLWTRRSVMDNLRNQFYAGTLVTGKRKTPASNLRHPERRHPNEWHIFENHHPAIVSTELFDDVQTILDTRRFACTISEMHTQHDDDAYLGKLLFCGHCGRKMKRRVWKGRTYFFCPQYMEAKGSCDINSLNKETLKHDIFDAIQSRIVEAQTYHDRQYRFEKSSLYTDHRKSLVSRLNALQERYINASQTRLFFYKDVCEGIYSPMVVPHICSN